MKRKKRKIKAGQLRVRDVTRIGECINIEGKKYQVKERCKSNRGSWFCLTHLQGFSTREARDYHLGYGEGHLLAWHCFEHRGLEELKR